MKVSDYIVEFIISKGITDVFGYPGGMITHLMDSFSKYSDQVTAHINYHEQASSFAACGYAQVKGVPGIAYATSGPGATNLLTGIANSYYDSIPTMFITGQVNTYESKGVLQVRQKGFQETDIVSLAKPITKYAVKITDPEDIPFELEKAFYKCTTGRKGPVLIDIPMDISRSEICIRQCREFIPSKFDKKLINIKGIVEELNNSHRPVIIAGRGIAISDAREEFRQLVDKLKIPIVTSMIAIDCIDGDSEYNFGFLGSYGHRFANFIVQNSDLILSLGSRLDCRQTGNQLETFAPRAKVIRIDIDEGEFTHKIKQDEKQIHADIKMVLQAWNRDSYPISKFDKWMKVCKQIKSELLGMDDMFPNLFAKKLGDILEKDAIITTDVGQNQVWIAQSLKVKPQFTVLFSGGLGAMGYSLPAAIGAYYASSSVDRKIVSVNGDGGFQMNLQELQFIVREKIPIKIVVFNNKSLGMIRHFQEMYFDSNYVQTKSESGYSAINLKKISEAFEIDYAIAGTLEEMDSYKKNFFDCRPFLLELNLSDATYVYPKLAMGHPIHDQDQLMDRGLFLKLSELCENE